VAAISFKVDADARDPLMRDATNQIDSGPCPRCGTPLRAPMGLMSHALAAHWARTARGRLTSTGGTCQVR
jgi:hypothetical protein